MVFRFDPKLPAHQVKTYTIVSPLSTHYRDGTCDEAGCLAQRHGWKSVIDEKDWIGQAQAARIRALKGRFKFTESRTAAGLTEFRFEAGQRCWQKHKVPLDRPEFYLRTGGDWRGNPLGDRIRHSGPDAWVNDFAEHQDQIDRVING